jgi:hypothetical protein
VFIHGSTDKLLTIATLVDGWGGGKAAVSVVCLNAAEQVLSLCAEQGFAEPDQIFPISSGLFLNWFDLPYATNLTIFFDEDSKDRVRVRVNDYDTRIISEETLVSTKMTSILDFISRKFGEHESDLTRYQRV